MAFISLVPSVALASVAKSTNSSYTFTKVLISCPSFIVCPFIFVLAIKLSEKSDIFPILPTFAKIELSKAPAYE